MGSRQTREQRNPEPEPPRTPGNEQPSNSLETQNQSNDFQHQSLVNEARAHSSLSEAEALALCEARAHSLFVLTLLIEAQIGLAIVARKYELDEQRRSDSREPRSNLTSDERIGDRGEPRNSAAPGEEKLYDPQDTTLELVNGNDDMDFECNDFKSLRAKMSCGHKVTPMSLTIWCKKQLDQGKYKFVCGQPGCNVEWPYEEVYKMALLTSEEIEYFEEKIYTITARNHLDVKSCPGCRCAVVRADMNNLRAYCPMCTRKKRQVFSFCWRCLKEWKGPAPRSDRCGNDECLSPLEILRTCPEIRFDNVVGVTGCPSIRACPTCGLLTEHDRTMCKNVTCPRCKVEFCFVCLKLTEICQRLKSGSYFRSCLTGVAQRQTSIPVWDRK